MLCVPIRIIQQREREHQERMMTRIYQQTSAIDVWLGPDQDSSMMVMDFINEFDGMDVPIVPRTSTSYPSGQKWLKAKMWDSAYVDHWHAFCLLLQLLYWTRLWIVQELVVTPCAERVQIIVRPFS